METETQAKLATLKQILSEMSSILLACSGGTDSMLLLDVAHEILGDNLAVATVSAPYMFAEEGREAAAEANRRGLRHYHPHLGFGEGPADLWRNTMDRCYLCKTYVFEELKRLQRRFGMTWLMDGTQKDDNPADRPGFRALRELGVRSPLLESGIGKEDIRKLAQARGLVCWDKPSNSCLLTRLPFDTAVTKEALRRVGEAEKLLVLYGLTRVRARLHGDNLRIETDSEGFAKVISEAAKLVPPLKELGFDRISLDLEGYRS
ncbi:MAG: ATP-dependent sacrificial sulfur transferase LarE [Peptococcaceae bacterium]|nr:ATP-dependent sacrificial sulfur transferase LarE [Peptococcaceae bacterium]